jgi:drug/metabolite transporter (DMT)-like permease
VSAGGVAKFDRWMLLMTVGTFCAADALLYFTQEYISLGQAILASSALAIVIIGVRAVTLMRVAVA